MFQPNSSRHQAINIPSTAAHGLTKKNISYLEHLCTQPPPINTTAPELTALLVHLWLLLIIRSYSLPLAGENAENPGANTAPLEYPNWRQITWASRRSQPWWHTVPQVSLYRTSTRPAFGACEPLSRTCITAGLKNWKKGVSLISLCSMVERLRLR